MILLFNDSARLVSMFPQMGRKTDHLDVRIKVVKNYQLFYRADQENIWIIRVWDSRQNPDSLRLP
jgi:toxin YoeB